MKKLLSLVVALCACSADPGYEPRYEPTERPSSRETVPSQTQTRSIEAPRKTVVALQACADRFASKLSGKADSYAVLYDLEIAGNGITAKVKDSMIPGTELESCLTNVLERMVIPDSVSSSSHVSPQSRSVVGVVQAAAVPIALLPIVLVAGGITILVGVTIHVVVEAVKRLPIEDEEDNQECVNGYVRCIATGGQVRGNNWNTTVCENCLRVCVNKREWPYSVPMFGKGNQLCY